MLGKQDVTYLLLCYILFFSGLEAVIFAIKQYFTEYEKEVLLCIVVDVETN